MWGILNSAGSGYPAHFPPIYRCNIKFLISSQLKFIKILTLIFYTNITGIKISKHRIICKYKFIYMKIFKLWIILDCDMDNGNIQDKVNILILYVLKFSKKAELSLP